MKTKIEILDYLRLKKLYYNVEYTSYRDMLKNSKVGSNDFRLYTIMVEKTYSKLVLVSDLLDFINGEEDK